MRYSVKKSRMYKKATLTSSNNHPMNPTNQPITISLIVPIYGVEAFIAPFAHSVLSQSYPHIQYIFVNDGTKDASMEVLGQIIDEHYPHRKAQIVIVNKKNGGLPAARHTGLQHVTGDYVYHVDPDDWLSTDAIALIAAKIVETGSDIIYFNYVKEYTNRSSVKREKPYSIAEKEHYIRAMYNHRAYGTLCNKCVKASLYTSHQLYTPRYGYAEDCCLSVQLVGYASSISYLDETLYHYRKSNPHAMTGQNLKKRKREYAENFLNLYETYKDIPSATNPIACLFDDIVIQAGWYSLLYRLGLFKQRPYLAQAIRRAKARRHTDVWFIGQAITKLYALFR